MNPLTNVVNQNKINYRELELGYTGTKNSWHNKYKDSAWIFIGGLPYDLTEGDILCIFSQYGEIVNVNLVRDKSTGKSKGFCFLCYEDQQSTILSVDNFNGTKVLGRILRVDHVESYRKPKENGEEDEITRLLREHGCAPQAPPLPGVSTLPGNPPKIHGLMPGVKMPDVESIVKIKKEKKKKSKKEKKKKKKNQETSSSSESEDSDVPQQKKSREDGQFKPRKQIRIKRESSSDGDEPQHHTIHKTQNRSSSSYNEERGRHNEPLSSSKPKHSEQSAPRRRQRSRSRSPDRQYRKEHRRSPDRKQSHRSRSRSQERRRHDRH